MSCVAHQRVPDKITQAVRRSLKEFGRRTYHGKRIEKKPCSAKWVGTYALAIATEAVEIATAQRGQRAVVRRRDAASKAATRRQREKTS